MGWVIFFFSSGLAFFCGAICVLAALVASLGRWRHWTKVSAIVMAVGIILVVLSATPLPIWFYAVAVVLTIVWLVRMRFARSTPALRKALLTVAVTGVWLGGMAVELWHQRMPIVTATGSPRLYLFGDSVSAGLNDQQTTWPRILAQMHDVDVVDYSRPGANTAIALSRATDALLGDGIVLLEIGGNDLLGATTDDEFARNLDALLSRVCRPGREVLMFELPLPPFRNQFGRIQRRLAAKHGVLLIPKRILAGVLTTDGATLDSIHLSNSGHRQMANVVWRMLEPAYVR